jgi:hypothetical protein
MDVRLHSKPWWTILETSFLLRFLDKAQATKLIHGGEKSLLQAGQKKNDIISQKTTY